MDSGTADEYSAPKQVVAGQAGCPALLHDRPSQHYRGASSRPRLSTLNRASLPVQPSLRALLQLHRLIEVDCFQDTLTVEWGDAPARRCRVKVEPA
jgi:hypothetical protein